MKNQVIVARVGRVFGKMSSHEGIAFSVHDFDLAYRLFVGKAQPFLDRGDAVFQGCDEANTQGLFGRQDERSTPANDDTLALGPQCQHCLRQAMHIGPLSGEWRGLEGSKRFQEPARSSFVQALQQTCVGPHVLSDPLQQLMIVNGPAELLPDCMPDCGTLCPGFARQGNRPGTGAQQLARASGIGLSFLFPIAAKVLNGLCHAMGRVFVFHGKPLGRRIASVSTRGYGSSGIRSFGNPSILACKGYANRRARLMPSRGLRGIGIAIALAGARMVRWATRYWLMAVRRTARFSEPQLNGQE